MGHLPGLLDLMKRSARLEPGTQVTHRTYGWPGVLAHREGALWSVIWSKSALFSGWTFSLQSEADLEAVSEPENQLELFG